MPGLDVTQEQLFSIRRTPDFVPEGHPPVAMREILNRALRDMDLLFESMYEERDRYSVPPEWLLRGLVLQALYGIRSERLLCEQLGYNMLHRWFVGLGMEDAAGSLHLHVSSGTSSAVRSIPAKATHRFAVVQRILHRRIRQIEPLLDDVDPQHPRQRCGGRSSSALG